MYPESFDPGEIPGSPPPSNQRMLAGLHPESMIGFESAPPPRRDHPGTLPTLGFESLPFAALLLDATGRVLACNTAAAGEAGLPLDAIVNTHVAEMLVSARQFDVTRNVLRRHGRCCGTVRLRSGRRLRIDITQIESESDSRYLAIADPVGSTLFADGARVVAEEVVHHVNNILAVVSLRAALAERSIDDPEGFAGHLRAIGNAVERASGLCRTLEGLAAGPPLAPHGTCDLGATLWELASEASPGTAALHFAVDVTASPLPIAVESSEVVRMVRILLAVVSEAATDPAEPILRSARETVDGRAMAALSVGFRGNRNLLVHAPGASRGHPSPSPAGFALAVLEELVTAVGGECSIVHSAGGVTRLVLRFPLAIPGAR